MTTSDLQHLLRYTHWANRALLDTLLNEEHVPEKCVHLMAHLISAEHLWLDRINGAEQRHAVWPDWAVFDCDLHQKDLESRWEKFFAVAHDPDLERLIPYKNSKGQSFTSSIQDILTHVILHAPHHRGQINIELRAEGFDPVYVDYIHAVRTHQLS